MKKVRAEIHLRNIKNNAAAFKRLTGNKLCAVVKADAYGHGAAVVTAALAGVADCFAVSLLDEAIAVRTAACGKDILILTPPVDEADAYAAVCGGFVLTVPDLYTAKLVVEAGKRSGRIARVHLKANTGMNRYGADIRTLGKLCAFFSRTDKARVEGIYSHIYECTPARALGQRELFLRAVDVCRRYFPGVTAHLSATYGALLGERFAFDMTRVGIGLYGYFPDGAQDIAERVKKELALQKGMTVYAVTAATRQYSFGGAGYGRAFEDESRPKRLSVVRFGYADGFLRQRKNGVCGAQNNANNLCMDACIRMGGRHRGAWEKIVDDAAEIARATDTISYEVLCAATRRAEITYDYE